MKSAEIKSGQEWTYKTRPNETNSTLVIGVLETHKEMGDIVHITVKNVKIKNSAMSDGFSKHIQHIPISKDALEDSLKSIVNDNEIADGIEQGLEEWRKSEGGAFECSVCEVVQYIEDVLTGGTEVDN